ncbi:MAG TPA: sensor histidine kinase [Bryobacteraceae bacterium]|nr:sensor histidine kinase [Bryobacteraceae bacterium]
MAVHADAADAGPGFGPSLGPRSGPGSSKLRWLLAAICAILLALVLISGILGMRYLDQMHAREREVTRALMDRTELLSALWVSIQNYNQAVQQYVQQADAERKQLARERIDRLTVEIDTDLRRYPADRDSLEAALFDGIEDVYTQQRRLYLLESEAPKRAREPLAQPVSALEKQGADWSRKFQAWNREKLRQADQAMAAKFTGAQNSLLRVLAIGFGSGLALVLGSMVYIVQLERQTRNRYVQLAQSKDELQRLSSRLVDAQETERRAISRELHDEIGQSLGALLVDIARLANATDRPEARSELERMKSLAERTLSGVRDMALLLRPSMLDDLGLVAALEWQAREVSRRSPMEVAVESEDVPEDLPDEVRVCIYRLVQEALNNAVRHSGARNAQVRVAQSTAAIEVRVADDGGGFDPVRTRGLGILGMEERVKRLGGSFRVESKPGQGTTVRALLPIRRPDPTGGPATLQL